MKRRKKIAVCASVSFYKDLFAIEKMLKNLGFTVLLPKTAYVMKRNDNFDVSSHKKWYQDPSLYHIKTSLMKDHFRKIVLSDAILVVNLEKNGIGGYIGGNTLMEMTIAFHHRKPIYILNAISEELSIKEEIFGMFPTFLNGNLSLIQ